MPNSIKKSTNPKGEGISKHTIFIIVLMAMCIIWLTFPQIVDFVFPHYSNKSFGDIFASLNTWFSGLALVGVIYTIYLQRQELQLQRRELELTRQELSKSSSAQLTQLHFDFIKMSINDEDLAGVWKSVKESDHKRTKQHLFINLILNDWEMLYQEGLYSLDYVKDLITQDLDTSKFCSYWAKTRKVREEALKVTGEKHRKFHETLEAIYHEYKDQSQ